MDDKFDSIVLGVGVAGLAAYMILSTNNMKFILIERDELADATIVSGA